MDRRKAEALQPKRYKVSIIVVDSPVDGEGHFSESEIAEIFAKCDLPAGVEAEDPLVEQVFR